MHLFGKIFQGRQSKQLSQKKQITIYLDAECKRSIQAKNQTVENFINESQFQQDQFLYITLKNKKTNQVVVKRKLNSFQFLSEVLENEVSQECKPFINVGYSNERNTIPKINAMMTISQTSKFIRSGTLSKWSDSKSIFEDCQLRLHHDYLTYYEMKVKEKRVSFMPLENASVEITNEKKHMFTVRDKFKNLLFKTTSKEDMIGWLLAINEAIRIRNAQIYMNQLDEKLEKKIKDKLAVYTNKCMNVKDPNKTMLLDEMGRKALRNYFKKNTELSEVKEDVKILSVIEMYLYMCQVRRQKGESESQQIIKNIKENILEIRQKLPEQIRKKQISSKQQLIKTIEQMMRYLDKKYKKALIDKKMMHSIFQTHMMSEYKKNSRFTMTTLFGENPND